MVISHLPGKQAAVKRRVFSEGRKMSVYQLGNALKHSGDDDDGERIDGWKAR